MINALSIDLEYWYSAELVKRFVPEKKEDQVIEAIMPLLSLLDKYDIKATFFVLGTLAEKYAELIKLIHGKGHEISSHAYSHKTLYELGEVGFEVEIIKSNNILKSITKESPIGFRAPTFSINNSTKWAFKILAKYGFKYDSSIFPIKTKLYGVPNSPITPYKPSENDVSKHDPDGEIIEFPLSVAKIGINIPIAGGFYFRFLPAYFIENAIRVINKTRPVVIYLHPWEMNTNTPRISLPLSSRFITYHEISSTSNKLEGLIKKFKFAPIREVLDL